MKRTRMSKIVIGGIAVLVLALSATLAFAQTGDGADATAPDAAPSLTERAEGLIGRIAHRGDRGDRFDVGKEYLADALGISVEELEAAGEAARESAEADRDAGVELERGDRDAYLADALGVSVEELEAAKAEAMEAGLTAAVAEGTITEERADLIRARHALQAYIDKTELMAEALGISVEELETARAEGVDMRDLLEELGLSRIDVAIAQLEAYQSALDQAVANGIITAEQAEQLDDMPRFGSKGRGHGHRGHGERGGPGGFAPEGAPDPSVPTGLDA